MSVDSVVPATFSSSESLCIENNWIQVFWSIVERTLDYRVCAEVYIDAAAAGKLSQQINSKFQSYLPSPAFTA